MTLEEAEAILIFNSGWTKKEIEELTVAELFEYVSLYYKQETEKWFEFLKAFSVYNAESTAVATHGKKGAMSKYLREVRSRKLVFKEDTQENIGDQFEGVDFGK